MFRTKSRPDGADAELWKEVQDEKATRDVAKLLYGENRQTPSEEEALAMGDTVLNRVDRPEWPNTVEEVLLQKGQYHPFDPASPQAGEVARFGPAHPMWEKYVGWARKVMAKGRPRGEQTHYSKGKPKFPLEGLTKIGAHWFGKEKPRGR